MGGVEINSAEASVLSFIAGSDMTLFAGPSEKDVGSAIEAVKRAIEEGRLSMKPQIGT